MVLCIEGFFPDGHENQLLHFELDIAPEFHKKVLKLVGWKSLQDGVNYGVLELTAKQAREIEDILGKSMPSELDLCISVFA
ncbi:hypothetical protein HU727_011420 [Pseudomonas sp. SWRI153]|uniref:Uncharacterized protein n=1 Tax=Pseudomonas khorasanensis TaxID=2745508 RepID=A0A923F447_9PSED|nr:pyocin S6 family toxin immunity protein [Pseudomonas khorasanensis]MBV4486201.1 hypothetical protein [Pseudomonas khorasanensis]